MSSKSGVKDQGMCISYTSVTARSVVTHCRCFPY